MNKKQVSILVITSIFVVLVAIYVVYSRRTNYSLGQTDSKNSSITLDGSTVLLKDGVGVMSDNSSSSLKITTKYEGLESKGDINNDGRVDSAYIISREDGQGNIVYYVAALLNKKEVLSSAITGLIGVNIIPLETSIKQGLISVTYKEKAIDPSSSKTVLFKINSNGLILEMVNVAEEVPKNVLPTLQSKKWSWVDTTYSNGKTVTPKKEGVFNISFSDNKQFSAGTDCNGVGGEYAIERNGLTLDKMISTMMYCDGSQESEYSKMLGDVNGYIIKDDGTLTLTMKKDVGQMHYK